MKIYYSSAAKPAAMLVSQLNSYVKGILDDDITLTDTEVAGEISNFKHYLSGGHMYFTLKDENASIAAVMYRSANQYLSFLPQDGMKVTVKGSVSIYVQSGKYQIYVRGMSPSGEGELYKQYEMLKTKLYSEGLFDEEHKKALPSIPMNVGIITSKFGAALQDMINISKRRFPLARLTVYPSLVQGISAPASLISGIKYFNEQYKSNAKDKVDIIIIGRGGGSIEDLWAFNNEQLAREIYASDIPVVSAVGHETDTTICDLVADMRAPTPSAAAELVFPDISEILDHLSRSEDVLRTHMDDIIFNAEELLKRFSPENIKNRLYDKYDKLESDILNAERAIQKEMQRRLDFSSDKLNYIASLLEARSPLSVLSRGYALVYDSEGRSLVSAKEASQNEQISIRFNDGCVSAKIQETNTEVSQNAEKRTKL